MDFAIFMAGVVLTLHLLFILWVILGWLFTRRRPLWRGLHIACVIYGIFIDTSNLTCPLTLAEARLEERGGMSPYHGPFILHVLELLVYPHIPLNALIAGTVLVCVGILGVYFWRYRNRDSGGW